jgi:hypothetical protein
MGRKVRVACPGAINHGMNRGDRCALISRAEARLYHHPPSPRLWRPGGTKTPRKTPSGIFTTEAQRHREGRGIYEGRFTIYDLGTLLSHRCAQMEHRFQTKIGSPRKIFGLVGRATGWPRAEGNPERLMRVGWLRAEMPLDRQMDCPAATPGHPDSPQPFFCRHHHKS